MSQIFHKSFNTIAKVSILGGVFILGALGWFLYEANRSPYMTQVGVAREQPVPFSHKHHVQGLGIDCRYCHTSVEDGPFAGIPPTQTCMNCHSIMWKDSPVLEPVRESFRTNEPIEWTRVHDLPDFTYFDHSIHIRKGVSCTTCHGQVDAMPLTWRTKTLHMQWCLECHRHPEHYVRPREAVFDPRWESDEKQEVLGARLVKEYKIESMMDCTVCHR
jgi:hypothetical protein